MSNTLKVLRGQESSLESSKGLYRGSSSYLTGLSIHAPKSMKIYKGLKKSVKTNYEIHEMRSYEIRWKSLEDKQRAWNRAQVYIGAAAPTSPA